VAQGKNQCFGDFGGFPAALPVAMCAAMEPPPFSVLSAGISGIRLACLELGREPW